MSKKAGRVGTKFFIKNTSLNFEHSLRNLRQSASKLTAGGIRGQFQENPRQSINACKFKKPNKKAVSLSRNGK
ncbi:MAG: hypothetical protein ABIQ40_15860 [Bacteroidia bacterium]